MAAGTCKGTELLLGVQCVSFQGQGLCSTCQLFQEGCGSSALGLLQNRGAVALRDVGTAGWGSGRFFQPE